MKGVNLKFFVHEFDKHHNIRLYEWLLESAKKYGIDGGSAFRAIAGYGRDGVLHEEHFFEMASNVSIEVSFFVLKEEAESFLTLLKNEKLKVFYVMTEAEFGILNEG